MKLFQAMLAGARQTYQAFGTWHDGDGGTCAMGAVMTGLGYKLNPHDWYEAHQATLESFPELRLNADCPACNLQVNMWFRAPTLMDVIMHLNDKHRWSRQRIAEWLSGEKVTENETPVQKTEACTCA